LRIGGEPIEAVRSLRSVSAARAHDRACDRRRQLADDVAIICSRLEALVPRTEDRALQRDLINVKRDLFNSRAPKLAAIGGIEAILDQDTRERLSTAIEGIEHLRELEQGAGEHYDADLGADAAALRTAASLPNLRAALNASSPSLFQALLKLESGAPLKRKDWNNLNLAISSYLTRSTLKTSPKSSLTLVALGAWDRAGSPGIEFALGDVTIRRDVRLRDSVIERVFRPVASSAGRLSSSAAVVANPTIRIESGHVEWQRIAFSEATEMETYGITATTNRLAAKQGLLAILHDLVSSGRPWTLEDYGDHLRSIAGLKSDGDAQTLLERLMSLELLVLTDDFPVQGDRTAWARSIARSTKASLAAELEAGLDRLEAARRAVSESGGDVAAGGAVEAALDDLSAVTGASIRSAQCRPVFHEDCLVTSPPILLREDAVDDLQRDLCDLVMLLPLLRGYGWASAWLVHRFVTTLGAGARLRDPTAFLAEAAEALAASTESSSESSPWQSGAVPDDADALAQDATSSAFMAELRAHNPGPGTWTIPRSLVHRFYRRLPESYRRRARSHCINGQFVSTLDSGKFVVNSVYPGNARMTSRFLGEAGPVAAYVAAVAPGLPVAIPGVFGFNANRHPPLSDHEISIPPYGCDYAHTHKYALDRCTLRHDPARNQLILEDEEGKSIFPFYFGILNSWALPPVHRVLDWMNGASDLPFSIVGAIFSGERPADPPPLWVRPRLALGELILARKSYSVAVDALPDPTLAESEFYFALRDFWQRHELPALTFFRASNVWQRGSATSARPHKTRKPMYLDIDNVWLVKAFQRSLRVINGHVSITEALPLPGDSPLTIAGKRHASEVTVELGLKEADG
jgi:hypothetical protein